MECRDAQPLLADYAAGALDAGKRRGVDDHLDAGCMRCRRDLAELLDAATLLVEAEGILTPPPRLRGAVLDRIDAESVRPTPSQTGGASWRRGPVATSLAACLAAVAVGAAYLSWSRLRPAYDPSLDALRARIAAIESELGVDQTRLVSLAVAPGEPSIVAHLIYDELAHELHVWTEPVDAEPPADWVWLLDAEGAVVADAPLARAGERHAAVLPIATLPDGVSRLVLSREPDGPGEAPGDDVVQRVELRVRGPAE